jgi:hypothetical protein
VSGLDGEAWFCRKTSLKVEITFLSSLSLRA